MASHKINYEHQGILTPEGGEFPPVPAEHLPADPSEQQLTNLGGIATTPEVTVLPEVDPETVSLKAEVGMLNYFGRENKALRNIWAQGRKIAQYQENYTTNHPGFACAVASRERSRLAAAKLVQLGKKKLAESAGIEVVEIEGDPKDPATAYVVKAKDPARRRELNDRYTSARSKYAEPKNDKTRKARLSNLEAKLQRKGSL